MFRFSSPPSHEDGSVRLAKNWEKLEGLDQALFIYLFFASLAREGKNNAWYVPTILENAPSRFGSFVNWQFVNIAAGIT